jgi:hypothetical protein
VGERGADQAGGVAYHEGHLLGGYGFRGDDEIGFVLARGVVEDDYEFAIGYKRGVGVSEYGGLGGPCDGEGWDGVPKAWIVSGMESNWEAGI